MTATRANARPLRTVDPAPASSTPTGLVWEEPPAKRAGKEVVSDEFLDALRAAPGNWARVKQYTSKTSANTAAVAINRKNRLGPGWEATARARNGGSALWLRWVGKA